MRGSQRGPQSRKLRQRVLKRREGEAQVEGEVVEGEVEERHRVKQLIMRISALQTWTRFWQRPYRLSLKMMWGQEKSKGEICGLMRRHSSLPAISLSRRSG